MLKIVLQVLVNFALVAAVFVAGAYIGSEIGGLVALPTLADPRIPDALAWSAALLVSLPFLIAAYRKLKALAMLLGELLVQPQAKVTRWKHLRRLLEELVPLTGVAGILLLIGAISASILPPWEWLAAILAGAALITALLWKFFVRLHTRLQVALIETMQAHGSH